MSDKQKTEQILALLTARHQGPEWATFAEMRTETGGVGRSIDLWVMNLWHSKRYVRIAYEIKVSRSDFARELADPRKRQAAESISNECYFATPPGLVMVDEVPEGWGLIEATKGGMRVKKRAMWRDVDKAPVSFVAALARRTSDSALKFPSLVWLYAGQEITREQLISIAETTLNRSIERAKLDAVVEFQSSDAYMDLLRFRRAVQRVLGYRCGYIEDLEPRLKQLINGGVETVGISPGLRDALFDVRREIDSLLNADSLNPRGRNDY